MFDDGKLKNIIKKDAEIASEREDDY